jgi:hypothetical protein
MMEAAPELRMGWFDLDAHCLIWPSHRSWRRMGRSRHVRKDRRWLGCLVGAAMALVADLTAP